MEKFEKDLMSMSIDDIKALLEVNRAKISELKGARKALAAEQLKAMLASKDEIVVLGKKMHAIEVYLASKGVKVTGTVLVPGILNALRARKTCIVDGCRNKVHKDGMCAVHLGET